MMALLDSLITDSRAQVVADTIRLVNIPSEEVSGAACVQQAVMEMAIRDGLFVKDYGCGVVSVSLYDRAPDLGIWVHADVVPAGDGWTRDPYDAYEYNGCIIGRGATDNKGQLAAIYRLLCLFKQQGMQLSYNPALYIGSNEESGMKDVIAFLETCTPPALSLVPDDGFAVGYGGKGALYLSVRAHHPFADLRVSAGEDASPGTATAVFADGTTLSAHTPPRHASNPDPGGNMITRLCEQLLNTDKTAADDRAVLEVFRRISLDTDGSFLGIRTAHSALGDLTVYAKSIVDCDGCPSLVLNIRYPVGITCEQLVERIDRAVAPYGCTVCDLRRGVDPYLHDPESAVVRLLCDVANAVTGENAKPHTLGGGTYAHRLPNAYPYGTDANVPPADFAKGKGGAHGIDEAASIDRLLRAMRVYARALLALDQHPEMFTNR